MKKSAIVLVLLAAVACGPKTKVTATDSGVQGQVLLGPTCPVQIVGQPCGDRPYQTTLRITQAENTVTTVKTDAEGRFKVTLDPGAYTIVAETKTSPPTGKPVQFTVSPHAYVTITVPVDSGIR